MHNCCKVSKKKCESRTHKIHCDPDVFNFFFASKIGALGCIALAQIKIMPAPTFYHLLVTT
jgi:hypothetical protein